MNKKTFVTFVSLILALVSIMVFFTACKKDDDISSSAPTEETSVESEEDAEIREDLIEGEPLEEKGVAYDEEQEGAELHRAPSSIAMYIGSWTAPSDMAQYLYGNVDLTIKEDGTWRGNITGENLGGKWVDQGDHLHMQNEMFSFDLAFDTSGKLILIEKNSDGELHTVLVRK